MEEFLRQEEHHRQVCNTRATLFPWCQGGGRGRADSGGIRVGIGGMGWPVGCGRLGDGEGMRVSGQFPAGTTGWLACHSW